MKTNEEFHENYLAEPLNLELWKSRQSTLHERDPLFEAFSSVDWRKKGYVTGVSVHLRMK